MESPCFLILSTQNLLCLYYCLNTYMQFFTAHWQTFIPVEINLLLLSFARCKFYWIPIFSNINACCISNVFYPQIPMGFFFSKRRKSILNSNGNPDKGLHCRLSVAYPLSREDKIIGWKPRLHTWYAWIIWCRIQEELEVIICSGFFTLWRNSMETFL